MSNAFSAILKRIQLGMSGDDTQNFVAKTNEDGTGGVYRGSLLNILSSIITWDANGKVAFPQGLAARTDTISTVRVHTSNGNGSASTAHRRFSVVVENQGTDITYADSATLGASFTINTAGVYAISYADGSATGAIDIGPSKNSNQPTTSISSITAAHRLCVASTAGTNYTAVASTVVVLAAGDVIRAQLTNAAANCAAPERAQFTITRVG